MLPLFVREYLGNPEKIKDVSNKFKKVVVASEYIINGEIELNEKFYPFFCTLPPLEDEEAKEFNVEVLKTLNELGARRIYVEVPSLSWYKYSFEIHESLKKTFTEILYRSNVKEIYLINSNINIARWTLYKIGVKLINTIEELKEFGAKYKLCIDIATMLNEDFFIPVVIRELKDYIRGLILANARLTINNNVFVWKRTMDAEEGYINYKYVIKLARKYLKDIDYLVEVEDLHTLKSNRKFFESIIR